MIFKFLKYLQPTSYFALRFNSPKGKVTAFPDVTKIPISIKNQIVADTFFQSPLATEYEMSWRLLHSGYIPEAPTYKEINKVPIIDEYKFIRKYFNPAWVLYVLVLRLLSFKNPVREIRSWINSRDSSKISPSANCIENPENINSCSLENKPLVSIIIPTLNRYEYLKDVLRDLEVQDYKNFEVIVVDQSEPFQKEFYSKFDLNLNLQTQTEKALWMARNKAINIAKGNFLLLFDDDSRVSPDWISSHMRAISVYGADISSGISISKIGAKVPSHYKCFKLSDQLDTGNVLIKREVFEKVGLFDLQFEKQRMGDGEFGLRCYLAGFLNISNPRAKRIHLKVNKGGLREMGSWDAFRPTSIFAPRPIPSVLYFYRRYFSPKRVVLSLIRTLPFSLVPYRFKSNKPLMVLGIFITILIFPVILFQIARSWVASTNKLKEGPKIPRLDGEA